MTRMISIPCCQRCGLHHPSLAIDEFGRCPMCAAEWDALVATGITDRTIVARWNKRSAERRIERRSVMAELHRSKVMV